MRPWFVAAPVTTQLYVPEVPLLFGTDAASVSHVTPPLRLNAISIGVFSPTLCVHLIVWVDPMTHLTLIFGCVTVITGTAIANPISLTSLIDPFSAETRIRPRVLAGGATVHAIEPDDAVAFCTAAAIGVHVTPSSRLISTATHELAPRL